jgi:hypothetical protein
VPRGSRLSVYAAGGHGSAQDFRRPPNLANQVRGQVRSALYLMRLVSIYRGVRRAAFGRQTCCYRQHFGQDRIFQLSVCRPAIDRIYDFWGFSTD